MHNQLDHSFKYYFIKFPGTFFYIFILIVFVSCKNSITEKHGFIAKLGNDTVSVENVERQGNTITSDEVDRFPRVQVRHTVINLNDDGSIKHLEMDIHTPSEPSDKRETKVIADVSNNEVHLSKTDSTGTLKRNFSTGGSMVVAHVPQMYSLYEIYFAAALKYAAKEKLANGTPVQMRQFYIDREFDNFPLGRAHVTPISNGKATITHDWLSGTGEATIDSNYHLLNYSGEQTTYKVIVNRLASPPDAKEIAERFECTERRSGDVKSLSVRDTVHAQINNAIFTIDYGRPLMRGRKLLGDVIPYDRVWRTGANAATQFTTSVPVKIHGTQIPAGTYTLWTAPHMNRVDLIVNKQAGIWGTDYRSSYNLGTVKMDIETLATPVEIFTISIVAVDKNHGILIMEWGNFKWTAQVTVQ